MENIYWWAPLKAVATSAPDPDSTFRFRVSLSLPHQSENVESWSIDFGRKWRRSRRVLGRLRWPLQSLSSASTVKKFTPFHLNFFFFHSYWFLFCVLFWAENVRVCSLFGCWFRLYAPGTTNLSHSFRKFFLFFSFLFFFFFFWVLARVKKKLLLYYWELFLGMCFWCCHEKLNYHIGFCV